MSDFDYESLFSKIQNDEYYTKDETIKYIQQLFGCLLNHPLESLIHPQAFLALKKQLKGNMAKYINDLKLDDLVELATSQKLLHIRRTGGHINYTKAAKLVVEFLKDKNSGSSREIRAYIKERSNINLSTGQWQTLRKHFPITLEGLTWALEISECLKSQAKWQIKIL
jgi:hypothetical protein